MPRLRQVGESATRCVSSYSTRLPRVGEGGRRGCGRSIGVRKARRLLLASLAGHDRKASDAQFIESSHGSSEAGDDRNFVKGVGGLCGAATRNAKDCRMRRLLWLSRFGGVGRGGSAVVGKDALRKDLKKADARNREILLRSAI